MKIYGSSEEQIIDIYQKYVLIGFETLQTLKKYPKSEKSDTQKISE